MSCPRCGSNDLWDDNLWWGCNHCGYACGPDGGTMMFAKNLPGLALDLKDIPGAYDPQFIHIVRDDENNS